MRPHDPTAFHEWRYADSPQPKRRPPTKRGYRQRLRDRTRRLQRALKQGDPMSLVIFEPKHGTDTHMDAGEWPQEVVGNGFIHLGLTWNREVLEARQATYEDQYGERYILERLRGGRIVGEIRED